MENEICWYENIQCVILCQDNYHTIRRNNKLLVGNQTC